MEELREEYYSPIPPILYHYTKPCNLKSIVSGAGGKDKEICFWANSNLCKNDAHELELGKRIYDKVKQWLISCGKGDYLSNLVDEKNSFSLSFTEGANSIEMIRKYGNVRLEFDFTNYYSKMELMPCEYCDETEIDRYAELIIDKYKTQFEKQEEFKISKEKQLSKLVQLVRQGGGIERSTIEKVFYVKSKSDWEGENEWRKIYSDFNRVVFYHPNGIPYIEVYLPIKCLTSVCLFNVDSIDLALSSYQYKDEFKGYLARQKWDIPVIIESL
jgi:hypothetical protein